ncbi:MAG: AtuA-related protein [Acidimicrobiales bacterium]
MAWAQLRGFCGARSGDKGDISDLSLFADDLEAYEFIRGAVTAERVKEHFASLVQGRVLRYEAVNVWALKFVMEQALGGGGPASLRSDNLGKTYGGSLLRMWVDVPIEILARSSRRPAPLPPPGDS